MPAQAPSLRTLDEARVRYQNNYGEPYPLPKVELECNFQIKYEHMHSLLVFSYFGKVNSVWQRLMVIPEKPNLLELAEEQHVGPSQVVPAATSGHRVSEGAQGFIRAALASGTPCLLAPKWNISSEGRDNLMTRVWTFILLNKV